MNLCAKTSRCSVPYLIGEKTMKSSPRFTTNLTLLVLVLLFAATPAVLAQDPANTSFKSDVEKAWKERIKRLSAYSSGSMTWAMQKKALMPDSQEGPPIW